MTEATGSRWFLLSAETEVLCQGGLMIPSSGQSSRLTVELFIMVRVRRRNVNQNNEESEVNNFLPSL